VRLLLDSHVFIWWLSDDDRLGPEFRAAIADPDSLVYVSAASIWELEIKAAIGRLTVTFDLLADVSANGFQSLAITTEHAVIAARLPRHHADPFDRMLIAQSQYEDLVLASDDHTIARYDVALLRPS
jgi:PIN domain nuclease of toxin-antitoxin system